MKISEKTRLTIAGWFGIWAIRLGGLGFLTGLVTGEMMRRRPELEDRHPVDVFVDFWEDPVGL